MPTCCSEGLSRSAVSFIQTYRCVSTFHLVRPTFAGTSFLDFGRLTHFGQNRPHEISKVAHLMKHEFGYLLIILDEGCMRKSSYIFAVLKVLISCDRETTEAVAQNLKARRQ